MIKSPCKECAKRHPACHDTCQEYQAFKIAADAVREERNRQYGNEATAYMSHQVETRTSRRR